MSNNNTNNSAAKIQQAIEDKVIYVAKNGISLEQILRLKKLGFVIIFK